MPALSSAWADVDREDALSAPAEGEHSPSRGTQAVLYGAYLLCLLLLFVAVGEGYARWKGVKPWQAEDLAVSTMRVDPGGRFYQPNDILGYTHIPGRFAVSIAASRPDGSRDDSKPEMRFNVTHLANTLRATRPEQQVVGSAGKVWIFGCSFTHGWSLNDNETYPWLLQQRFPEYDISNFGVSGYGEIHSLLQFREALKSRTPAVVVLAYASFHDERNTFARIRRKAIVPWNRLGPVQQPYARLDASGNLQFFKADVVFREFPLMRTLAFSHYLEMTYDALEFERTRSREVSQALIREMAALAASRGVKFLVASIDGPPMTAFYDSARIPFVDIAVDLKLPANSNKPYDGHPSARANEQYADKLELALGTTLGNSQHTGIAKHP